MEEKQWFREYVKYVSLNVLGMLGLSCYILADTFFVSRGLGADGLAALNLAIPVYNFINGCGLMLGMGGAARYSISRAQGQREMPDKIFMNTLYAGAFFYILFMALGIFGSSGLTGFLGADGPVYEMTHIYLKVMLIFAPFYMFNGILNCFVRNDGAPGLGMYAMLGGSAINIVLDYVFIFPLHMGMLGAVLATAFAPVCGILVLSSFFVKGRNHFHFRPVRPELRICRKNMVLGFPALVTEVSAGLVIVIFNILILRLEGTVGVAAYGIIANVSLVLIAVYTGVAQGIQPVCSDAKGRGEVRKAGRILYYAVFTVLISSVAIYLFMFFFAGSVTEIFNSEGSQSLARIAVRGIRIYFTAIPFAGFNVVLAAYFAAMDRAVPAQIISLLRGFVLIIPLACILPVFWEMDGIWLAFPLTEAVTAAVGGWCLKGKRKSHRP